MVVIPPESGAVQLCDAASPSVFSALKTPFGLILLHFLVHLVPHLINFLLHLLINLFVVNLLHHHHLYELSVLVTKPRLPSFMLRKKHQIMIPIMHCIYLDKYFNNLGPFRTNEIKKNICTRKGLTLTWTGPEKQKKWDLIKQLYIWKHLPFYVWYIMRWPFSGISNRCMKNTLLHLWVVSIMVISCCRDCNYVEDPCCAAAHHNLITGMDHISPIS